LTSAALLFAGLAFAQSAQISGLVTDPSGASIPGAQVIIANQNTGIERTIETNESGFFVLPSVQPGIYRVTVTADGFRSSSRTDLTINVEQVARVDMQLEIGAVSETVEVSQEAPLLETSRATVGTVIANKQILDLPLNGRNPFSLANLTPGVNTVGTGATPIMGGGRASMSEVTIDGVSNVAPENNVGINRLVYTPQVDSVQEFKVELNSLAAEYGRFSGGVINVITKGGTNELHGTGYWFLRRDELDANSWASNRAGRDKSDFQRDQWGGTIGGPIARDKTFFFFGYEGTNTKNQATSQQTVPISAWRQGDFSNLLANNNHRIFDPLTLDPACSGSSDCIRQPFANNIIPSARFSNVALKTQALLPDPNQAPTNAILQNNNYFNNGQSTSDGYRVDTRIDHNPTDSWRLFGRYSWQTGNSDPFLPWDNAAAPVGGPNHNWDTNIALDSTWTLSPTLIANLRYGFGRANGLRTNYSEGFDMRELGLPENMYQQAALAGLAFPRFNMTDTSSFGASDWTQLDNISMTHSIAGSITKVLNRHTIKAGADLRKMFVNFAQWGQPAGSLSFSRLWTQENPFVNSGTRGFGYASFLLGNYSGASMSHEIRGATASLYTGFYVQDDWRVNNKLTLNIGMRYDVDNPRTERFNRMSYFDPDVTSVIAGQVPTDICANCADLRGSLFFLDDDNRQQAPTDRNNWGPRIGLAYQLNDKTVIRTGYGIAYLPTPLQAAGTTGTSGMQGFRTTTNAVVSSNGNRTADFLSDNPFGNGFYLPTNGALGGMTDVGFGIGDSYFNSYQAGMQQQWNFNVQRQLPGDMSIEIGYIGSRGSFLPDGDGNRSFSQLPRSYLSLGSKLTEQVANPFYGVITDPNSSLSRPTVALNQLLRPFPQYTGVSANRKPNGNSEYHALTVRVDKRFSNGLSFLLSFTGGKMMDDASSTVGFQGPIVGNKLDHYDRRNDWSLSSMDVSRRFVASWNYELPFGRGKAIGGNAPGVINHIIGGWQTNGILTLSGGAPLWISGSFTNAQIFSGQRANSTGTSADLGGRGGRTTDQYLDQWFDTDQFTAPGPFTLGNVSRLLPDVRGPGTNSMDLSFFKNNYFGNSERYNVQFRIEMFNALNTPQWNNPNTDFFSGNFGRITNASNSRQIQLATKFVF
jgi:hypothetical protein